ncbi:Orf33, orf151, orf56, orf96, rus, orf45, orf8, orf127, and nmpC genes [Escherichia coli]|uniref:Orf33, orf151, orf56, orf96, rus, orf45, orf8, orf127, and nmpC genes n=1 Tax=Escherichia coli TaxID=562 RepID=Q47273_ECOLX|nr:unnamed protein product [Escherichia coli]CAI4147318.1 Orf33, orf151, orf56, orf96, rus, orf45, orf8, orf127, and nmpC genes [Escherichia coli]CAI6184083.1 Orf33, orf151, orf56, orf96, rus, orf45, orf8, orf127, and nmpC genes [Escherichia coli]CAI6190248.1 Orf33, orf151, orf56, orf96, rus, orf45, orf8, orf127, and nmpC genes [Escherichia coli]CAI9747271.1 Orf33, orf151, orf56, orf96, rus, orf45, orf8, orf127, and nmpC genes [Escherichia coli]
MKSEITIN